MAAISFGMATAEGLARRLPGLIEVAGDLEEYPSASRARGAPERREALEYPLTFFGTVEALRRPRPTLRGELHGRSRAVWIDLDGDDYQTAIRAHTTQAIVRVVGTIRERGRATPRFIHVESFEAADDGGPDRLRRSFRMT